MKPILYLVVLCVVGYFVWNFIAEPSQPLRVVSQPSQPLLSEPPPIPNGRVVNDQYNSLDVGNTSYSDVTVKMVYPDSISIIHRDGAITVPLANLTKEIQDKYNYDPAYEQEYISLKASHAQYRKDKAKQKEEKHNEITTVENKPTAAPIAVTNPTVQPPVANIPGTLRMLISKGNEGVARTEFEKYLRTAPRLEARGTVLRHLESGHLLVKGSVGDPRTRSINYQMYLLFGLPEADRLADGDTFDAFAVMGDAIETADGTRTREYIYVDEGGRRPVRFARNSGIYD